VLVPISNDLLRYASVSADNMVRNDLVRAIAVRRTRPSSAAPAPAYTPKGLKNWAKNTAGANATVNARQRHRDLKKLIGATCRTPTSA
jgi:hypothetical protein